MAKKKSDTSEGRRVYQWREGHRHRAPAQVVGERLQLLEGSPSGLSPQSFIADARDKASPLHPLLTWDDSVAGERWRVYQSRQIMSGLTFTVVESSAKPKPPAPMIAFVSTNKSRADPPRYESTPRAMASPDSRATVLRMALLQLRGWQVRFSHLAELGDVFKAIDEAIKKYGDPSSKEGKQPA